MIKAAKNNEMKSIRHTIPVIMLFFWVLPGVAAARTNLANIPYFTNLYSHTPGANATPTKVPDPKSTQVQVFIYKKSSVLWSKPIPGLQPLAPGTATASPKVSVKDPHLAGLIQKYAKQHGVDAKLVQAMIQQESNFNPLAVSPKGAMGLMQLMPETAASLGVEDPFDLEQNIKGGVRFLKICLNKFDKFLVVKKFPPVKTVNRIHIAAVAINIVVILDLNITFNPNFFSFPVSIFLLNCILKSLLQNS
jgi:hypothetical protein